MPNLSPTYLSTLSGNTPIPAFGGLVASVNGGTAVANRAIYIPFFIPAVFTVQRFAVVPGSAIGPNYDLGVYDFSGNKLVSTGSFVSSHANSAVQHQAPSGGALKLQPGRYYLAFACDVATANGITIGGAGPMQQAMEMAGCLQQDTAFPLPSLFTPVEVTSGTYPVFGITQTAS